MLILNRKYGAALEMKHSQKKGELRGDRDLTLLVQRKQ
jgi:hypothetical protein